VQVNIFRPAHVAVTDDLRDRLVVDALLPESSDAGVPQVMASAPAELGCV